MNTNEDMPEPSSGEKQALAIVEDGSLSHDEKLAKLAELPDDFGYSEMVFLQKTASQDLAEGMQ
jgi:hypothetical protein